MLRIEDECDEGCVEMKGTGPNSGDEPKASQCFPSDRCGLSGELESRGCEIGTVSGLSPPSTKRKK